MKNTIRRLQNKIINECEALGHIHKDNLICEQYKNKKTGEEFEIYYDHDTTPVKIVNVTIGQTWNRD